MATAFLHGFSKKHLVAAVMLCTAAMQASAAHSRPDKLLGGETLTAGEYLTSPNGQARLQMRSDGNLVLTRLTDGAQLWALGTSSPGAYTVLQTNGNLQVVSAGGAVLWQTSTGTNPGAQLLAQSDHNVVLYKTSTVRWAPLWNTVTGNGNYSTPSYEPAYWNDASTAQYNNNCYNYSNNRRTDTFAQPGRAHGVSGYPMDVTAVRNAAIADGLIPTNATDPAPQGKTRVALVVWPGYDYHWYRKDSNGYWTHKPGQTAATNRDNSGALITNPETANRGGYTAFGGYFFTPSSEIQGQGHAVIQ